MKNRDAHDSLPPLPLPEGDPADRERALHRALIAFRHPSPEPVTSPARPRYRLAFGGVTLLLLTALLGLHFGQREGDGESLATLAKTLREIETLFPRQLNAIVEKHGDIRLDLSPSPGSSVGPPVYVELHRGAHSIRIISYSGRSITVTLGGQEVTFEPLITGSGEVILLGNDFVWPDAEAPFHAKVRPLFAS